MPEATGAWSELLRPGPEQEMRLLFHMDPEEDAIWMAGLNCAMGSAGCDMAYCAYSLCDKGNGVIGKYSECPGWDPVKGMPVPAFARPFAKS